MKPKKLSFSERDGHGNGRGVVITLENDVTPEQVIDIFDDYINNVGWQPSRLTKRAVDWANECSDFTAELEIKDGKVIGMRVIRPTTNTSR